MKREEKVAILKAIINIDTTNGNEEEVADYLKNLLAKHGIDSEKIVYSPGRANLVSSIGSKSGKVLGFSGHMDVVAAGNRGEWHTPPFTATEKEGNLYGRGAADMKSGLAALVIAMIELKEANTPLNGEIRLLATVGEEIGELGAEQLTHLGYVDDLDSLLIGEPSGPKIIYAHKGSMNYTVTSYGKSAHSSMPEEGENAIDHLMTFYQAVSKYVSGRKEKNDTLGEFTHSFTVINGGVQVNSIPEKAVMQGNIRTIPEVPNEEIKKAFSEIVTELNKQPFVRLELVWDYNKQIVFSQKNSEIAQITKKVGEKIINKEIPFVALPGTTDAAEFIKAKKEFPVVIFGAGNDTLHQVNEYISLDDYIEIIDIYKEIAVEYLNG